MSDTNPLREARRLKAAGRLSEAAALLERDLPDAGGERLAALRELADIRARQALWSDADARIDEALALSEEPHDRAALLERRAFILFRQGRADEAEQVAREALALVDAATQPAVAAALRNILAGVAWREGRLESAIDDLTRAVTLFAEAGDRFGIANAKTNLGVLFLTNGEWQKAVESLAESEVIRRSIDCTPGRSSNLLSLGWLQALRGERAEARSHLEESLRIATDTGEEYDIVHADLALAYLEFLENRIADADRHLDSVLLHRRCASTGDLVQVQWLRALIECNRGSAERAVGLAKDACKLAEESKSIDSQIDSWRALGMTYARSENFEDAEESLTRSVQLAERAGDPYKQALALLELAMLYERAASRQPSGIDRWRIEVRKQAENAGRLFRRLGARVDLQRAEQLRARVAQA